MDVDNDPIDQNLLLQFTCLGTTDRDDLVKQFKELCDNRIDDTTATFFLEMNNWNLQNAICSFFDYDGPHKVPSMIVEESKIISSGEMAPNTRFSQRWTIRNSGSECWPHGCFLQHISGDHPCNVKTIPVRVLPPGLSTTIVIDFVAPSECGIYQSKWRMTTPFGCYFGDILWVVFQVSARLNDTEEINLSEELASRMALIDSNENRVMEEEINCRSNNPFSVSVLDRIGPAEQMPDIEQGDKEFS